MRSRLRSFFALLGVVAISAIGLVALAPAAMADTIGPVDPTIPDGDPGSLRDVLESQVSDGDTVVLEAGATYQLTCDGGGSLNTSNFIIVQGNGATIEQTCDELVWDSNGSLHLDSLTITGGFDDDDRAAGGIHQDGEDLIITNSSFVGNATCGDGGAINMDSSGLLHIENSTIAGNSAGTEGGAIASHAGSESSFVIVNSTITDNTAEVGGGIFDHDGGSLTLVYVTMASNAADTPGIPCEVTEDSTVDTGVSATEGDVDALANGTGANIEFYESESVLTTFGSVIALPIEGPNCNVGGLQPAAALGNTVSLGYNYSDDESCDLTGTGDRQGAADPQLLELAANGGPTMTRLPAETSPLIDGVALDACHPEGIDTDQRGVVRPQRAACDVGAVELEAVMPPPTPTPEPAPAALVTPRFTG